MSSIYRKGRDGYFYYQTYCYNPKTGKKDKKIFHALGTKDETAAQKMKTEYDIKYDKKNIKIDKISYFKKVTTIIGVTAAIFYLMLKLRQEHPTPSNNSANQISNSFDQSILDQADIEATKDSNISQKIITPDDKGSSLMPLENHNFDIIGAKKDQTVIIPDYNTIRIEEISGVFQQGKFYLTANPNLSSNQLRLICDDIRLNYKEYSNLVIFIYADTPDGAILATGGDNKLNQKKRTDAWLGMYTYNPVEGDYFDDNPTGYLGELQ